MVVELKGVAPAEREASFTLESQRAAGFTFGTLTSAIIPNQQVGRVRC
jgi:hypothetical protein